MSVEKNAVSFQTNDGFFYTKPTEQELPSMLSGGKFSTFLSSFLSRMPCDK